MDEDVDFFDMRGRFKVVQKRKRDKNVEDDSDSDSSSVSSRHSKILHVLTSLGSDESITELAPRKSTYTIALGTKDPDDSVPNKPAPPPKKRRPMIALSSEDEEANSEAEPEPPSKNGKRSFSLTPPPTVGEEALQQALAVINDHLNHTTKSRAARARTRQQTSDSTIVEPLPDASSDADDDFDLEAYQRSMNSDIAKQATVLYGRPQEEKPVETRVLLILVGKKFEGETLPTEWIKPIGMKVMSTMQFAKLREEFKKQRGYSGDVVLVLRGMRLYHGTPKSLGLKDQTLIGMASHLGLGVTLDVFTENGYKIFEEREKEKAATKLRTGAIELSSDEEEEDQPPQPEIVVLHLQGPEGKYRFKLPNVNPLVFFIRTKTSDLHYPQS